MIRPGPLLRERTTIGLGGKARAEITPEREADLEKIPGMLAELGGSALVLGGGSNYIFADGELPLVVISLGRQAFGYKPRYMGTVHSSDGEKVLVRVGGAARMPGVLRELARMKLSGLEGLAGIPGTVGGALAMNAGSFGCETLQCVHSVRIFSPEHGIVDVERSACEPVYRHCEFIVKGRKMPSWFLILDAVLALSPNAATPEKTMRSVLARKNATQPVAAQSAGCVFKNPAPGVSAGKLLDEAGFKGKSRGGIFFSEKHANFLINSGCGRSEDAVHLLIEARRAVAARTGHVLQLEARLWPPVAELE